jgi:hypothetical protein
MDMGHSAKKPVSRCPQVRRTRNMCLYTHTTTVIKPCMSIEKPLRPLLAAVSGGAYLSRSDAKQWSRPLVALGPAASLSSQLLQIQMCHRTDQQCLPMPCPLADRTGQSDAAPTAGDPVQELPPTRMPRRKYQTLQPQCSQVLCCSAADTLLQHGSAHAISNACLGPTCSLVQAHGGVWPRGCLHLRHLAAPTCRSRA